MIEVRLAGPDDAAAVVAAIHESFADRPVLDPPATALAETEETVAAALAVHGGLIARRDGRVVGALLFHVADTHPDLLVLRRVGVHPDARRHGVAAALAERAAGVAAERGYRGLALEARVELPATIRFWCRHGYVEVDRDGPTLRMLRLLPTTLTLPTAEDTRTAGRRLGALLRAGDVVILTGGLGAGKTTFTQGLAEGLGVRGPITSPTFVISRIHPSLGDGPALVHADAYRIGGAAELDDLDLDTDLDRAVTVVEWGEGLAEVLAADHLVLRFETTAAEIRTVTVNPVGARWLGLDLGALLA